MAILLVFLLLLTVPVSAFTSTDVYYVTADDAAGHEQSCPPHQICHNLSYYIFQPGRYFTSNTTIIFLEGNHSYDGEVHVVISNVYNLTLKGQGQWPIKGAEETVMQSTVIINCTRGRGGFIFDRSHSITVESLTVVNCGRDIQNGVFSFSWVTNVIFLKNSIQHMMGCGLAINVCKNPIVITNCSFYSSTPLNINLDILEYHYSSAIDFSYRGSFSSEGNYQLNLSYSNITKCRTNGNGGGIGFNALFGSFKLFFEHLVLSQNTAVMVGGMYFEGFADSTDSTLFVNVINTDLIDNYGSSTNDISFSSKMHSTFNLLGSTIVHTGMTYSDYGVYIHGVEFTFVTLGDTRMKFANLQIAGFCMKMMSGLQSLDIYGCQFESSHNVSVILLVLEPLLLTITNCIFTNNTGRNSVIVVFCNAVLKGYNSFVNNVISNNNMTGINLIASEVIFNGRNVIQNNRNTEGAGITLSMLASITVFGELCLYNNTADERGGAILLQSSTNALDPQKGCTIATDDGGYGTINFSGNRARIAGSDVYGAVLMGCDAVPHVGHPNETSWYFDTPLSKQFHFTNTDRLSSMASDPIMVCFCNNSGLPDCSDRTQHHMQYPGLEISTSIATVGYYGGTSPGVVQVSTQHAALVRSYGQSFTKNCFQLHIVLQNTSSATALVDIRVDHGLPGWGLSIGVDIMECPIGFTKISGQCHCEQILSASNVQCNLSTTSVEFLRSGNSWFAYINNTQCITGTTNCPYDYCNQTNVSFDIMAPDHQCIGNRTGILCGQCQSHLSIMLGSNRCGTCSNWYLFLLPVFAIAGIVLVAMLMFLNLSVSVGTINGLLFYANMVKLNEAFFFPNGSIPVMSQFISWLNLELGIEVCLFDGLDGYWNTWLQFAFPAYLFLLMGGIIVGCRYSVWLCRLCGSHAVPALATLFFMSYTKILLTVTNALSMFQLPCNDSILIVWSVDGDIDYGSFKHLILVAISCFVLVVGLVYPVLVLCAPLLERYSDKCIPLHRWNPVAKFKPLLDAYGGPYKDKFRFWTGVTLMVRLTLTVTFSFTSGKLAAINSCIIITVVTGIFIFWSLTKGVYKNIYLSTLEVFYLLNILLLSTVSLAAASIRFKQYQIATIVSVCLSFVVCLVTMAIHLWWNLDFKKIKRKLGFKDRPECIEVPQVASEEDDEEDRPPPGSPPSIVYGSSRGEHRFVLEFQSHDGRDSVSPVLLAREPLLFDT